MSGILRRYGEVYLQVKVIKCSLTDPEHNEEDDEGMHHRHDGSSHGRYHSLEFFDAPKEANYTKRPHELDEPVGNVGNPEINERNAHYDHIEPVPTVALKAFEPVGKNVEN